MADIMAEPNKSSLFDVIKNNQAEFRLQQLTLEDFRQFKHLDIEFESDLTVFIGINGSGKTTVIDAMNKVLSRIVAHIDSPNRKGSILVNSDIRLPNGEVAVVDAKIQVAELGCRQLSVFNGMLVKSNKGAIKPAQTQWQDFNSLSRSYRQAYDTRRHSNLPINMPIFAYYDANRGDSKLIRTDLENITGLDSDSPLDAYDESAFKGTGHTTNFLKWFVKLNNLAQASLQQQFLALSNEVAALKESAVDDSHALWSLLQQKQQLLSDVAVKLDSGVIRQSQQALLCFQTAIEFIIPDVKRVYVERGSGRTQVMIENTLGIVLELNSISQGQKVMLSLVADLVRRILMLNPHFTDLSQAYGVVLIDEIELHLHPDWQQKILNSLQQIFPKIQFIVTTHSPQVLSTVESRCIRIFSQDVEGNDCLVKPKLQTQGLASSDILERVMGTLSQPRIEIHHQYLQFSQLVSAGQLAQANEMLELLKSHYGNSLDDPHPVIADCLEQIKLYELKQRMKQRMA